MVLHNPYRLTSGRLMETLKNWDRLMNFRARLIACGGTALTLLNIKESTKDIDFLVPHVTECEKLMTFLKNIGYREMGGGLGHSDDPNFLYQFWSGKQVFTTELLESPLEEDKHIPIKTFAHIYLGALNLDDLIITKVFRGTKVDVDDCMAVFETGQVNANELFERYVEAANYDVNPKRMMHNFVNFVDQLALNKLVPAEFVEQVKSRR